MKITKYITVETEVEVTIGVDDLRTIFDELTGEASERLVLELVADMTVFARSLTDRHIASMDDGTRTILSEFFRDQAGRFKVQH